MIKFLRRLSVIFFQKSPLIPCEIKLKHIFLWNFDMNERVAVSFVRKYYTLYGQNIYGTALNI